jgi:hypothetical protein
LDEITILRRNRRLKGVTGDTLENTASSVTGDTLTPSKVTQSLGKTQNPTCDSSLSLSQRKSLPIRRDKKESRAVSKTKENSNGEYEVHDTGTSAGGISTTVGDAPRQQEGAGRRMASALGRSSKAARTAQRQAGPARDPRRPVNVVPSTEPAEDIADVLKQLAELRKFVNGGAR